MELFGWDLYLIGQSIVVWHVFLLVLALFFALLRKLAYPEKSYKNALLSTVLGVVRLLKIGPYRHGAVTVKNAIKYAHKKTKGLEDWGSTAFMDNYARIMETDFHKAQKFTNLGYITASKELNLTLVRRLFFQKFIKETPQVLDVPVRAPTFVMGLPRTGTTFLHRLLALDPAVRAPVTWELLDPVPRVPGTDASGKPDLAAFTKDRAIRRKHISAILDMRQGLGDNALSHIHEVGLDLPEECLLCLTDELPVLTQHLYSAYMHNEEFLKIDATAAYKRYRSQLQLLTYQVEGTTKEPKNWMLKCPIHLFYPKEIAKAFPDAKLVWTHREPVEAVPSLCSLVRAFHQLYFDKNGRDDAKLGMAIQRVSEALLSNAPSHIRESGLPCGHVAYTDLIKDPKAVVKRLYKDFGWQYTEAYDAVLDAFLRKDAEKRAAVKKQRGGNSAALHSYSPEEYGLDAKTLSEGKFKTYIDRFLS